MYLEFIYFFCIIKDSQNNMEMKANTLIAPKTVAERVRYVEEKQQQLKAATPGSSSFLRSPTVVMGPETTSFSTTIKFNSQSAETSPITDRIEHQQQTEQHRLHHHNLEPNILTKRQSFKLHAEKKDHFSFPVQSNDIPESDREKLKEKELAGNFSKIHLNANKYYTSTANEDSDCRDSADEEVQSYFNRKNSQDVENSETEMEDECTTTHWNKGLKDHDKSTATTTRVMGLKLMRNGINKIQYNKIIIIHMIYFNL